MPTSFTGTYLHLHLGFVSLAAAAASIGAVSHACSMSVAVVDQTTNQQCEGRKKMNGDKVNDEDNDGDGDDDDEYEYEY